MMNGSLLKDGYFPITVLNREAETFHRELGAFYETGNANGVFKFLQINKEKPSRNLPAKSKGKKLKTADFGLYKRRSGSPQASKY